jgi:outer membrane immunogenic protein
MRRQILLASVGAIAIAIAGSAVAADLRPPPVYLPPPPIFSWTGLYMGGQIGYAWGSDPINEVDQTGATAPAFFNIQPNGVIGGAHVGYNLQIAQWVAGLEGTVDGSSLSGTASDVQPTGGVAMSVRTEVQGSIRARVGVAFDRVLIYGTGGVAFAGFDDNYSGAGPTFSLNEQDSKTRTGWTVGGGIDYAVTNNWSIGVEYRYSDFGRSTDYPSIAGAGGVITDGNVFFTHHLTESQVQAIFSYKFSPAPAPVIAKY